MGEQGVDLGALKARAAALRAECGTGIFALVGGK